VKRSLRCALSGVLLDDGNPLHRSTMRTWRGRDELVCVAVAGVMDYALHDRDVEAFARTMREREERLAS
jgi:hypothetical protein